MDFRVDKRLLWLVDRATRITCAFESFLLSVEIWVIFRERQSNVFRTFSLALVEKGLSHFFAQKAKTVLANAFTQMDRFRYSMTWSDTNFYKLQIHIHVTVNTLRKESHWENNFFLRWNLLSLVSFPYYFWISNLKTYAQYRKSFSYFILPKSFFFSTL